MENVRVWAPIPKNVELQLSSRRLAMSREASGWWTAEISSLDADGDYGFVLDGEGPLPDPRSGSQPHGALGFSHRVQHNAFTWSDAGWQAPPLSSAVFYEMHVGTFTPAGTFEAAIEKLDHLVALGVTHLELMPVNEFAGDRGWGYDGVNLFAPHHAYGGPEGLKRLVNACHVKHLDVILDVVYNHFGPAGHHWKKFAPFFKPGYATPWGPAINFDDAQSDDVRRFFCDNAIQWLRDYHFDGLRLDALHAIVDLSAEPFLEQLAAEVKELEAQVGRHLSLIAEDGRNDPRILRSRGRGGFALHAQWNDDFHHSLHSALTGERTGYYRDFGSIADLAKALRNAYVYDGRYSEFMQRRHGRPPTGLDGHRFLAYLQNHDQIGNRAIGDRSGRLMSVGKLKIAAALIFTSPFLPMLFQGEEWAASSPFLYFCDHEDQELAKAVREGRRKEFAAFGWKPEEIPDPQSPETFARSKLDWTELAAPTHADLLAWHKQLIRLRRAERPLSDGRLEEVRTHFSEEDRWLLVERGEWTIACNLASKPASLRLRDGDHQLVLASDVGIIGTSPTLTLPAESVAILRGNHC
ncbi:MAG TPA: malto-oligosyltrehalose trehalohydrolase [Verrucomicrobiae bacterium]|jgi:maltooligosyltrehalose trehalohydrolase|nr:malto-oligosyltrehalose trehalohydrolase [Verrucomicrobiae bacterium]